VEQYPPFFSKKKEEEAKWSVPSVELIRISFWESRRQRTQFKRRNNRKSSENLRRPSFTYFFKICIPFYQRNFKCNEQWT